MELTSIDTIAEILERHKAELLADWLKELQNTGLRPDDLMSIRFAIARSERLYSRAREGVSFYTSKSHCSIAIFQGRYDAGSDRI